MPPANAGLDATEAWKKSRSGAWAGRGFDYQHLVSTLILVRQWAGLAPSGSLVPEGFEDCVIESAGRDIWIQIKSRKDGTFSNTEVCRFLNALDRKPKPAKIGTEIRTVVVLEQPYSGIEEVGIDQLFEDAPPPIIVCKGPSHEIVSLLSAQLDTAEVIAEGLASDLCQLVAAASAANASLSFEERRRISTTEVERRVFERLEAEDPSAIDSAFVSGALEPVDFTTQVNEPDFYRGVKVRPGHVAAGLVLDRPNDLHNVVTKLEQHRHVLVSGPSGAGKSALVWLSANALDGNLRWLQITRIATVAHAEAIARFVRARRPTDISPIGLVFDEVGSTNSDLWNVLVRELRGLPAVYLLGSVRQEDVDFIADQSDTELISVSLDEILAESVWEKLSAANQTNWAHWREPFEQSEGLMLEYVHLLTQGKRLAAVIGEQVRQREHERRDDELAIIRSAAVIFTHGGEVRTNRLLDLLALDPEAANCSLRRLIDEHLVRESRLGVLGGLHGIRSEALAKASHSETVFLTEETLWRSLPATTSETLPRVVRSILASSQTDEQTQTLCKLAETLGDNLDIEIWAAILAGLGLATLERHVTLFTSILEQHGVERAHWPAASMFADSGIKIPDLSLSDQWQSLRKAILAFRASPEHDLRSACLKQLPAGSTLPSCHSMREANKMLSCLVPICGGKPIPLPSDLDITDEGELGIRQIAPLLSTAYLIGTDVAERLVDSLGGEQRLLDLFHSQTPWTTAPVIEPDGSHGRTIRSNWLLVAEQYQPDPHEAVCDICETLIALSPSSDAAASDAVNPMGQVIAIGNFTPYSKNMPRQNIPAKARVAWNVAFRQILLAKSAADSLTDYTSRMAPLVRQTEKVFRSFTENWITRKNIPNRDSLIAEINGVVDAVNKLAYATPGISPSVMTEPVPAGTDDTLGALLTGVLGNLVWRLNEIEKAKAAATYAGSLAAQARLHHQSDIWRTMTAPPLKELADLSERLDDVSCILHEMAHDKGQAAIQKIVKAARKGNWGKAIRLAAVRCRSLANRRFRDRLRALENALKEQGWNARCLSRAINKIDSPYWPAMEIVILVETPDLETVWIPYVAEGIATAKNRIGDDWPFLTVPVMNGQVLGYLALRPLSRVMPDQSFAREWSEYIDKPLFFSEVLERLGDGLDACVQLSAIMAWRGLEGLHQEEGEVFTKAEESFNHNRDIIANAAEQMRTEYLICALAYLDRSGNQIVSEFEAIKAKGVVEEPLYRDAYLVLAGEENECAAESAATRLFILQAECNSSAIRRENQTSGTM